MLSSLTPTASRFLTDLARINARSDKAQRQLSSGLKLERPSDDPDQVSLLLETRAELARVSQVNDNLGRVKTEVDTAAGAINSAVDAVERVRVLAAQAVNSTQTAETRASAAGEVQDLLGQLVRIANTSVEGRYIFSGNSDQTTPFTTDFTQPYPVSPYNGSAATRQALDASGTSFPISKSGDEIFISPDPTKNVFAVVSDLHNAMMANDQAGIQSSLGTIGTVLAHLNSQVAYYGTIQNQVTQASDQSNHSVTQLKIRVSDIQDADIAGAITELQQAKTQQDAALGARVQMPQRSLFDYMK